MIEAEEEDKYVCVLYYEDGVIHYNIDISLDTALLLTRTIILMEGFSTLYLSYISPSNLALCFSSGGRTESKRHPFDLNLLTPKPES